MGLRLRDLKDDRRETVVRIGGKFDLGIVYRPGAFDGEMEEEVLKLRSEGRSIKALAVQLAGSLVDWDLEDDRGEKVPITCENLEALGLVLQDIHMGIAADLSPNRKSATP